MKNFNTYEQATPEQKAIQDKELQQREERYKNYYKIESNENGFTVFEADSHYSDSLVASGEWMHYFTELNAYKTLKAAKSRIAKELFYNFSVQWFGAEAENAINRLIESYIV